MKFPAYKFWAFCNQLKIDSKEKGQTRLSSPLGTQRYAIQEIISGLEEGKHFFTILKGRQQGITTITLALDLFWHWMYPGMQGTLIADNDGNKEGFRTTLRMFQSGLPTSHRIRLVEDNRTAMVWKNRSRMFFQTANAKKKGGGGRGKGIIFLHGTETGFWDDEQSLESILQSLAEKNDQRLHIFESTANGYNMFKDMYDDATNAVTQKAIFVGWWRNEMYHVHQDSPEYRAYWDGNLTPTERDWHRAIKLKYKVELNSRQVAWYRWNLAEKMHDNETMMLQEHPWLPEQAFQLSGSAFFTLSKLEEIEKQIESEEAPSYYTFRFAENFADVAMVETIERNATLCIWEEPSKDGYYAIGADPAYGSSNWKDQFCIQVYRCYADRIEQVAEFCTTELRTDLFGWVICYLCGIYNNSILNLEMNGPGQQVYQEMLTLKRIASLTPQTSDAPGMFSFLNGVKAYLYKRLDTFGGGVVPHWITTDKTKERMMSAMRDATERGDMIHHSLDLLSECRTVIRDDGMIASPGRKKDDRVIASALAIMPWVSSMKMSLWQMNETYQVAKEREAKMRAQNRDETAVETVVDRTVKNFLKRLGA